MAETRPVADVINGLRSALGKNGEPASLRTVAGYLNKSYQTIDNWLKGVKPSPADVAEMAIGTKLAYSAALEIYLAMAEGEDNEREPEAVLQE